MKLTTFLILISVISVWANKSYSQTKKINLSLEKTTIREVLSKIEDQSEFYFMFSGKVVDVDREVSINANDKNIESVLNSLFKGTNIDYTIKDRIIVLSPTEIQDYGVSSQNRPVSGKVTDSSGVPLPGVTVAIKGTTHGAVTNPDGIYALKNVPDDATLLFSFVGMKSQEVAVAGKTIINVSLVDETIGVEEVVVVGYGTQKKINLTGSIDVVTGEQLANRPSPSVSLLLQGTSPNLNISYNELGGEPGAEQNWQIRGIGTISDYSSSDPLILVDGVETDISFVDPESIESVSILKDASASAVYGSRAAFGVVLITTKKGKQNEPMQIQYTNNVSVAIPIYIPDMYDSYTYAIAFNQARANAGLSPKFSEEQVERILGYIEGTYPYEYDPDNPPSSIWRGRHDGNANNNWTQEYYKSYSIHQKHNISLKGGGEKTQYYLTAGFLNQPGLYSWGDDGYKRYNIVANITSKINDWVGLDFSTKYARSETDTPLGMVGASRKYTWSQFLDFWPTMPKYNIDGTIANPLIHVLKYGGRILTQKHDMWMNLGINLEPVKGWKTTLKYNYNYRWGTETENPKPVYVPLPTGGTGNIGESKSGYRKNMNQSQYNIFSAYSSYEKSIKKHFFKALIGYEQDKKYYEDIYATKLNLITEEVPSISTAIGEYTVDDKMYHWGTQGIFGRLNYNYDEKILFEFSARYDGSSKFAKGKRWGFFPSASVGYNIAKENFWNTIRPYVNTLKLRASYGELGNQNVSNYLYLSTIEFDYNYDESSSSNPGYIIDDEIPLHASTPAIVSSDLTWETIRTFDIGLDAGFLKNRLNLVFDWYNRVTIDMIGPSEDLPSVLGTSAPVSNNAELSTKGFELALNWKDKIKSGLSYNVGLSLGNYKTTILKYLNESGSISSWYAGKKYGEIWGLTTDGLIQEDGEEMHDQSYYYSSWGPGDMKYKDLTDDGVIDPGTETLDDHGDLSVIGNSTPKFNFGITAGVNWKNFDVTMFWQGVGKYDFLPRKWAELFWGMNQSPNTSGLFRGGPALDYWRPADETNFLGPNTDAYLPKPYFSSQRNKNVQNQTRYVLDAAYIRLKNIQIGYTVPPKLLNKLLIKQARIYFSGENLLTFSRLPSLFEPETIIAAHPDNGGNDLGQIYPINKMISFGVTLTF